MIYLSRRAGSKVALQIDTDKEINLTAASWARMGKKDKRKLLLIVDDEKLRSLYYILATWDCDVSIIEEIAGRRFLNL